MSEESFKFCGEKKKRKKGSVRDIRFFSFMEKKCTSGGNGGEMDEKSIRRESFQIQPSPLTPSPPLGNENDEQSLDVH